MKKLLRLLPVLLVALMGLSFAACSDDEETINPDKLPATAQSFISTYFPSATVVSTTKDNNEYEVILSEGTRIDFDKKGEWTDVDAVAGKTIPSGFYPALIDTYIADNLESTGINEISKEKHGYDVELVNGFDLRFSTDGTFLGADVD